MLQSRWAWKHYRSHLRKDSNPETVEIGCVDKGGYVKLGKRRDSEAPKQTILNSHYDKASASSEAMVSLDDAVLARLEKGGSRYEILVDPDLVESWKEDNDSVELGELLAIEEVWSDARAGERPTGESLEKTFGTTEILECARITLKRGGIQLTTAQRKHMVEAKKLQIINEIASTATDPKTKMPHPRTRIENASMRLDSRLTPSNL